MPPPSPLVMQMRALVNSSFRSPYHGQHAATINENVKRRIVPFCFLPVRHGAHRPAALLW